MGGGSSVMGMIAYRGSPDDYAEWEALGAAGWGWNDVLPFFRKLERDLDFGGEQHGKDGPVPIRRTRPGGLGAAVQGGACLRPGAPDPFIADMNTDFRDGLRRGADEQLAREARLGGDLLSRPGGARTPEPDHHQSCDRDGHVVRGQTRHRRRCPHRRRAQTIHGTPDHRLDGRHPFADLPDAHGHRTRAASARTRHRGSRRPAGVGQNLSNPRHRVRRPVAEPWRAAGGVAPAASDDGVPLFVRTAGHAAARPVHQRAVQDVVEPTRLPGREPRPDAAQAAGARAGLAARGRLAAAGRVQLHRPRPRSQALHDGLPAGGGRAGPRKGARDERRDVPGQVQTTDCAASTASTPRTSCRAR